MQRLLKSAYCFFAALLLTTAAAAQHKISGRVIDTTQEPLVGATITLKEKPSVGTTTDTEGRYTLTLPDQKEYTVQVSFVGYVTATKKNNSCPSKSSRFHSERRSDESEYRSYHRNTYSETTERCSDHHPGNHSRRSEESGRNPYRTIASGRATGYRVLLFNGSAGKAQHAGIWR